MNSDVTPFLEVVKDRLNQCLPGDRREYQIYWRPIEGGFRCEFSWCETCIEFEGHALKKGVQLLTLPNSASESVIGCIARSVLLIIQSVGYGKIVFRSRGNGKCVNRAVNFEVICLVSFHSRI